MPPYGGTPLFFDSVDFPALELPAPALQLREEVRAFLREKVAAGAFTPHLGANRRVNDNKLSLCGSDSCGQADGVKGAM